MRACMRACECFSSSMPSYVSLFRCCVFLNAVTYLCYMYYFYVVHV